MNTRNTLLTIVALACTMQSGINGMWYPHGQPMSPASPAYQHLGSHSAPPTYGHSSPQHLHTGSPILPQPHHLRYQQFSTAPLQPLHAFTPVPVYQYQQVNPIPTNLSPQQIDTQMKEVAQQYAVLMEVKRQQEQAQQAKAEEQQREAKEKQKSKDRCARFDEIYTQWPLNISEKTDHNDKPLQDFIQKYVHLLVK